MIRFHLFKIPVQVGFIHWLSLSLLAFFWCAFGEMSFLLLLLFLLALAMTMLVHELGHALVGRYLGGGVPVIHVGLFSGYCENQGLQLKREEHMVMLLAGSGATLCWAALVFTVLAFVFGGFIPAWEFIMQHLFYGSYRVLGIGSLGMGMELLISFLGSCIWWSIWGAVFNLLPIYPSDGGRLFMLKVMSRRKAFLVSYVLAICLALLTLLTGCCVLIPLYLILSAVENYQAFKKETL